jgi:hypothetical protein
LQLDQAPLLQLHTKDMPFFGRPEYGQKSCAISHKLFPFGPLGRNPFIVIYCLDSYYRSRK